MSMSEGERYGLDVDYAAKFLEEETAKGQQDTTEQTAPAGLIPLGTTGDVIPARVLETLTGAAGSDVVEAVNYTTMTAPEMLSACGADASKWAAAFCQTAAQLGVTQQGGPLDEGWMIGWFANAIEHSGAVRRWIAEKANGLLSDDGLSRAIAATPADRVTEEYIRSRIVGTDYMTVPNTTVTICHITLDNGYSVRGESACVNPANFRQDIGERIAHDDAFRKLWPLFGFLLAEANHRRGHGVPAVPVDLIARTAFEAEQASGGQVWGDLTDDDRTAVMARVGNLLADPTGEGEDVTFRAVVRGLTA